MEKKKDSLRYGMSVWILSDYGECNNFTNDPIDLGNDYTLCASENGCTFCEDADLGDFTGFVVCGVFSSYEKAKKHLLDDVANSEVIATADFHNIDGELIGTWFYMKPPERGRTEVPTRYFIERDELDRP